MASLPPKQILDAFRQHGHLGGQIQLQHHPAPPAPQRALDPPQIMEALAGSSVPQTAVRDHMASYNGSVYEPQSDKGYTPLTDRIGTGLNENGVVRHSLLKKFLQDFGQRVASLPHHASARPLFADAKLHQAASASYSIHQVDRLLASTQKTPQAQALATLWSRMKEAPEKVSPDQRNVLLNHLSQLAALAHGSLDGEARSVGNTTVRGLHDTVDGPILHVHLPTPTGMQGNILADNLTDNQSGRIPASDGQGLHVEVGPHGPVVSGEPTLANRNLLRTAAPVGDGSFTKTVAKPVDSNAVHIRTMDGDQQFQHIADPRLQLHPSQKPGNYLVVKEPQGKTKALEVLTEWAKKFGLSQKTEKFNLAHKETAGGELTTSDPHKAVVISLGSSPDRQLINHAWNLITQLQKDFNLKAELHVHDPKLVPGNAVRVMDHIHTDKAGTLLIRRTKDEEGPNAVPVHVTRKEALR